MMLGLVASGCLFWYAYNAVAIQSVDGEDHLKLEESLHYYNEGVEYMKLGNVKNAKESFLAAVTIHNYFPEAHQNLANTYEMESNFEIAVTHHRLSMQYAKTNRFKIMAALNVVTSELKRSIVRQKKELKALLSLLVDVASLTLLEPQSKIYFSAGLVYDLMGEPHNALQMFKETLYLEPTHTLALLNMGNFYFRRNKFDIAMVFYQQSLQSIEDGVDHSDNLKFVLNNLGQCYREKGQFRLSLSAFTRAHLTASTTGTVNGWTIGNIFAIKGLLCDWQNSEHVEYDFERSIKDFTLNANSFVATEESYIDPYGVSLMTYSALSVDKVVCIKACKMQPFFSHEESNRKYFEIENAAPLIRVGYLSFDWRDHPMGRLTLFLVTNHNTSRFNSTSISYGPNDFSNIRKDVERLSTSFLDVFTMTNDFEVASLLQSMDFDILIDLTSHTYSGRIDILALKPAPIIINYLGFPGTTGCTSYDYSMVDHHVVPPEYHSKAFSENMIYLPFSYQANSMPIDVPLCSNLTDCRHQRNKFSTKIGNDDLQAWLSPQYRWLCSFNANKKMERISYSTWMNTMRRMPQSILLLQDTNAEAKENILQQARFHGVMLSRIIFIPTLQWKDHLFRAAACDLVLDTFIYGAHTTSSDMLWMWVPVLSLSSWGSGRMPSRVAASITQSLSASVVSSDQNKENIEDSFQPSDILVQYSVKAYEDAAVRLLKSAKVLSSLHESIGSLTLRSPTFDSHLMERSIEQAYQLAMELRFLRQNEQGLLDSNKLRSRASIVMSTTVTDHPEKNWRYNTCLKALEKASMGVVPSEEIRDSILRRCKCNFVKNISSEALPHYVSQYVEVEEANLSIVASNYNFMETLRFIVNNRSLDQLANFRGWYRSPENIASVHNSPLFDIALLVESIVLWQQDLLTSCHLESQVFEFIFPFFFNSISLSKLYETNSNKFDPVQFNYKSSVWNDSFSENSSLYLLDVLKASHFSSLNNASRSFFQLKELVFSNIPNRSIAVSEALHFIRNQLALMLNSHGVCQNSLQSLEESVYSFLSSFILCNNTRGLLNAGIVLMDMGYLDIGFILASKAHIFDHSLSFNHQNSHLVKTYSGVGNYTSNSLNIAIYCNEYGQSWWPEWGPSSLHGRGMGGSEEAVYYTSIELAKLGHSVYIYAELKDVDVGYVVEFNESCESIGKEQICKTGKVTWLHYHSFNMDTEFDVFIAWRYVLSLSLSKSCKLSFLWLHDLIAAATLPKSYFKIFSGIFVQSSFHTSYVSNLFSTIATINLDRDVYSAGDLKKLDDDMIVGGKYDKNIVIVPNGISEMYILDGPNEKHNFIYGSAPNRGLQYVLESWGYIKSHIPSAKLHVYYGFTEAFQLSMKRSMGEQSFNSWHKSMKSLLLQEGVEYHGSVNHSELTNAYRNAGFFLYPTDFQETGCISALRAMSCGCIPITSRLIESVLYNLTGRFDMGPLTPLTLTTARNRTAHRDWLVNQWAVSVVEAYHSDEALLLARRDEMKTSIRKEYAWSNTAVQMLNAFNFK